MLQVSAIGSLAGALGSLYATEKWSFIAARLVASAHDVQNNTQDFSYDRALHYITHFLIHIGIL